MEHLTTEQPNPETAHIDSLSALEVVRLMNSEDRGVALAVERVLPTIAQAAETIADRMRGGGRLIYLGAGTSGRLGSWTPRNVHLPSARVPNRWWASLLAALRR